MRNNREIRFNHDHHQDHNEGNIRSIGIKPGGQWGNHKIREENMRNMRSRRKSMGGQ